MSDYDAQISYCQLNSHCTQITFNISLFKYQTNYTLDMDRQSGGGGRSGLAKLGIGMEPKMPTNELEVGQTLYQRDDPCHRLSAQSTVCAGP